MYENWRTSNILYFVGPRNGWSSITKQTILNTFICPLRPPWPQCQRILYTSICLKHRTNEAALTLSRSQYWPVVNVKMALTCSSRDWLSDLNVNVSTFISFITRLSRLAKSPLLVDLDHTLMMTTRFLIYIKLYPGLRFKIVDVTIFTKISLQAFGQLDACKKAKST